MSTISPEIRIPSVCEQLPNGTRYFDNGNRLTQDSCALLARDRENASILDYNTTQYYELPGCYNLESLQQKALCHPNLRFKLGYGTPPSCKIDQEVSARYNDMRGRERMQLNARNFQAVPNLGRGLPQPNTESVLQNGMDTTALRQCDRLMEREFDVLTPFVPEVSACVNNSLEVLSNFEFRQGKDSRQVFREFIRNCAKE